MRAKEDMQYLIASSSSSLSNVHPEIGLLAEVLKQAIKDYLAPTTCWHLEHASNSRCYRIHKDAKEWFESNEMHPFSFLEICSVIGYNPRGFRKTMSAFFREEQENRLTRIRERPPYRQRKNYSVKAPRIAVHKRGTSRTRLSA